MRIAGTDDDLKALYLVLPGNVRAEISMARIERYEKTGKPPVISPGTILDDLRRRDFTVNAMALSLNPGSRGLLMDPFNGAADIEAKLLRVLHNYAFVEDPSRLIRASRFAARFHWPLEERTQARFESAKENNYIEYMTDRAIGQEIEALAEQQAPGRQQIGACASQAYFATMANLLRWWMRVAQTWAEFARTAAARSGGPAG